MHASIHTYICQVSEWPKRDAELRLATVADLYKQHAQRGRNVWQQRSEADRQAAALALGRGGGGRGHWRLARERIEPALVVSEGGLVVAAVEAGEEEEEQSGGGSSDDGAGGQVRRRDCCCI